MSTPDTGNCRHLFVFGLGYTGIRLARAARQQGYAVSGTVRDASKATEAERAAAGVQVICYKHGDDMTEVSKALETATHIICTAPPSAELGDPFLHDFGPLLKGEGYAGRIKWAAYLSTTGVYGDRDGGLVDETSELRPVGRRGELRVQAETAWLATGLPVHIFRLPGIYGPGRGPLTKIREGSARRIAKPNHKFNRIHVDDIVGALLASMAAPAPQPRAYNITDDMPAPQEEVVSFGCELLGTPAPPLVDFEEASKHMSAMALSFYAENKRVSNARMREELGYELKYPTFREGMRAQLAEEQAMAAQGSRFGSGRARKWPGLMPLPAIVCRAWHRLRRGAHPRAVLLVDNGSVRAASTLSLRRVAAAVEQRIGFRVYPVSCRFSNRVRPEDLGGVPADILTPLVRRLAEDGVTEFLVLPMFFGMSAALTDYLPEQFSAVQQSYPGVTYKLAPCLVDLDNPDDNRIGRILVDLVQDVIQRKGLDDVAVVVCDHGTPLLPVHQCRELVTAQVARLLEGKVRRVAQASMERREGSEYDFNEPLLETVFDHDGFGQGDVVVAMMFLSPGKHAGAGGDVATILQGAESRHPQLRTHMTALVASHPLLVDIIADRYAYATAR